MSKHRHLHIDGIKIENSRAKHDYTFEETEIAGICLEGWEVKAFLSGCAQLTGSHVFFKDEEAFLVGAIISPIISTGVHEGAQQTRKLLMTKRQIKKWSGKVQQSGYTVVPIDMHYSENKRVKVRIALAKGKKEFDKREAAKEADVKRQVEQVMKSHK